MPAGAAEKRLICTAEAEEGARWMDLLGEGKRQ